MDRGKITLGVIMIVKNEEQALPGILSDVKDIADEIMIVDTGSEDGTVSVAESFGAKIETLPWQNDFAAARNHSIECASCDYLLWLDADDRIDEKDRAALVSLKTRLSPGQDRAYMLRILSCSQDMPETISFQTRIIPNRDGIRFEGRVHEQILPSLERAGIKVESSDIVIRHTGYHDKDARLAKGRRNLQILLNEYREGKDTATQSFFIAMAYIGCEEYAHCLEYLDMARQRRTTEDWYQFSFAISIDCLVKLNRINDALEEAARATRLFDASGFMMYLYAQACMRAGRYGEAARAFLKADTLTFEIGTYPIPPGLKNTIPCHYGMALEKDGHIDEAIRAYRQSLQSDPAQKDANQALGLALLKKGQLEDALPHLEQARNQTDGFDRAVWISLAKLYDFTGRPSEAYTLYSEAFQHDDQNKDTLAGLIRTSIACDDVDALVAAMNAFMRMLGLNTDREINSVSEIAQICAEIGYALHLGGDPAISDKLAEAALCIDPDCAHAHMLRSDLALGEGRKEEGIESLKKALLCGAPVHEVERRMQQFA